MKALLAVLLLAACNPTLSAQSVAPPGRVARLDAVDGFWTIKSYKLELSRGIAIAITCNKGAPCHALHVVADDPQIAEVHDASFGVLEPSHGGPYAADNYATTTAFVVVGKAAGTTKLHVAAEEGTRTVAVTVVPPAKPDDRSMTRR